MRPAEQVKLETEGCCLVSGPEVLAASSDVCVQGLIVDAAAPEFIDFLDKDRTRNEIFRRLRGVFQAVECDDREWCLYWFIRQTVYFCEAHVLKAIAADGQGDKRERGLFTDLCFRAYHAFFRLQGESTYSIGVRYPSDIDFA